MIKRKRQKNGIKLHHALFESWLGFIENKYYKIQCNYIKEEKSITELRKGRR